MIWDTPIEVTLFGYDDSNNEFLSNTYRIETEEGPLLHATISGSDASELRMYRSLDGENFSLVTGAGTTLTATGTLDFTSVRGNFWRFGFRNTEGSPDSTPLCTVEMSVRKDPEANIHNMHDRDAEIFVVTTAASFDCHTGVVPEVKVYGNYTNLEYMWCMGDA